jgi:hypothetical protein
MAQTLHFLSVIERALRNSHPKQALAAAFSEIQAQGQKAENAGAYGQFCLFLSAAMQHGVPAQNELDSQIADGMRLLMLDMAYGVTGVSPSEHRAALEMIQSVPALKAQYDMMLAEARQEMRLCFVLERDGAVLSPPRWDGRPLRDIAPGHYVLKLDTGRVLWEGQLAKEHLLWRDAYPGEPLRVAASTPGAGQPPTFRSLLLNGRVALLVFAGIAAGSIQVEVIEARSHGR